MAVGTFVAVGLYFSAAVVVAVACCVVAAAAFTAAAAVAVEEHFGADFGYFCSQRSPYLYLCHCVPGLGYPTRAGYPRLWISHGGVLIFQPFETGI